MISNPFEIHRIIKLFCRREKPIFNLFLATFFNLYAQNDGQGQGVKAGTKTGKKLKK
jgi:hypothetical protein